MGHDQAQQIIVDGRNSFFASELVDTFLPLGAEFQAVAQRYAISAIGEVA